MIERAKETIKMKDDFEREIAGQMQCVQEIVDRNMRGSGVSLPEMSSKMVHEFCDRVSKYVSFELSESDGVEEDLPIGFIGPGGYVILQNGDFIDTDAIPPGDLIGGSVDSCTVLVVASPGYINQHLERSTMLDPLAIPKDELSMSAGIVLKNACYFAGRRSNGEYEKRTELSKYSVIIPTIYQTKPMKISPR